ncbi:MAG: PBP1A family penicillin-binding protein [Syntrophomonadaceae bacterium]|nr:PBP1A family penicillin-binding protein [Syntrophomonadaceae bacterium]
MFKRLILYSLILTLFIGNCAFSFSMPQVEVPEASVVYDINGQPVKGLGEQNRISINLEEMPDSFIKAIIAVEDKNFYRHYGIDIGGILRAMYINIKAGEVVEGGSTITQQTAKNLFLSNERTFLRKAKELLYALELERKYSKDEILSMYCNTIYFGQGAYGIEVAARTFFAKNAKDLSLAESALLAGLPRWPTQYNPYIYPEAAKKRQAVVLQRMVDEEIITQDEKKKALAQALNYRKGDYIAGEAPYFIAMVKQYLSEKYGERMVYQGGLQVYTTLDLFMQKAANQAFQAGMQDRDPKLQAALVAMDVSNGQIRALIGGRNYGDSTFNRVYSERQPGSTFKPFMYSLALDYGLTPAYQVMCEEVEFKLPTGDVYRPTDYGDEPYHWRKFTLKEAVMKSDNVVAVQVNEYLGPANSARHAEKFGFKNIQPVLSLPLGSSVVKPVDMAAAYSVFANQGIYSNPSYILKVADKNGVVLEESHLYQRKVIGADNAYVITDMLKGVLEPGGTGSQLKNIVGRPAAGKTGTTDQFNDAWFVGYTPKLCCAVWVGYDQNQNVNLTGSVACGPIWANFMHDASIKLAEGDFVKPDNVIKLNICLDSGKVASESCPRQIEMAFIEGTQPEEICPEHGAEEEEYENDESWLPGLLRR